MRLKILLVILTTLTIAGCSISGMSAYQAPTTNVPTETLVASPSPVPSTSHATAEASPTSVDRLCVTAQVAVYLRSSPSTDEYPIMPLPNGAELIDLGERNGSWSLVQYGNEQGWVHQNYITGC